ncbi:MAG: SDR family oxidoreductase [Gemmatimonadota bacterium]|jgi:NAD(P)-dependent dehydrogenase (short-subunit alcohol dehydrogenase family)|nr:SDR family oxidoreductase [Gemmatimonadota bacterium]
MQLRERVALVTGGGSGIGLATALLFAREGARVAVLGRTEDELRDAVREIEGAGSEGMALVADVSEPEAMRRATGELMGRWGRLDIVFANAGVNGVWAPIEELEVDEWKSTLDINLTGTFLTLKYTVPHLKQRGGAVVINGSINGTRVFSNTGASAYASSKGGQLALAKMLALELAPHRVRVNIVCPGAIETDIGENTEKRDLEEVQFPVEYPEGAHPLRGEPGKSEQVAHAVLFLASDAASHVTGTELFVDGAESLLGMVG